MGAPAAILDQPKEPPKVTGRVGQLAGTAASSELFALGNASGVVTVLNSRTGVRDRNLFTGLSGYTSGMDILDSTVIIGQSDTLTVFNSLTRSVVFQVRLADKITSADILRYDGASYVGVADRSGIVAVLNVTTRLMVSQFETKEAGVSSVALVRDNGDLCIAAVDRNGAIRFWNTRTQSIERNLKRPSARLTRLYSLRNGSNDSLIGGDIHGGVTIWQNSSKPRTINTGHNYISAIAEMEIAGDGYILTAGYDRTVRVFGRHDGRLAAIVPTHYRPSKLVPLKDGVLAVELENGTLMLELTGRWANLSRLRHKLTDSRVPR